MPPSPLIDSKTPRRPRIYLDLCVIQRPFDTDDQQRIRDETDALLRIVRLIEDGVVELVGSFALEFESSKNSDPDKRDHTEMLLSLASERVPPSRAVERRADIYKAFGLKAWDATHLAVAVEAGADYFCTCDDRLLRRSRAADTGLTRAVSMLELIEEVER
jgi:predicted nucleic acid-binding protein